MKKLLVIVSLLSAISYSSVLIAGQVAVMQPFPTDLASASAVLDNSGSMDIFTVPSDKHFVLTHVVSNGNTTVPNKVYTHFGVTISEIGTGSAFTNVIIGHYSRINSTSGDTSYATDQQVSLGYGIVFQPNSVIRLTYDTLLRGYVTLTGYYY